MKLLNKLTDSSMLNEAADKKFVSDAEKTAISHSNRTVLDNLSEVAGELAYKSTPIGGAGGSENLTDTVLTLGNYRISHNTITDKLDFEYVV